MRWCRWMTALSAMALLALSVSTLHAQKPWPRFRGPNGSGSSDASGLPVLFGPERGVAWSLDVPPGSSSPILVEGRLFLTGIDDDRLVVLTIDADTGELLWRRELRRARRHEMYHQNDSATPSPATDGRSVFVFFTELGLVSFDLDGNERWRHELGPFDNFYGIGASPIAADGLVLMVADQRSGSFLLAVDADTGQERWKTPRPGRLESFTTPVLIPSAEDPTQVVVFGAGWIDAYDLNSGAPAWSLQGAGQEPVASPVVDGSRLVVTVHDTGSVLPAFAGFADADANADGTLSAAEFGTIGGFGEHFGFFDRNGDGYLTAAEWREVRELYSVDDWGLLAVELPEPGTEEAPRLLWSQQQSVAYIASPLIHDGVVYMVKDGGILSSVDLETGEVLKRARTSRSAGRNFASMVTGEGKIYVASTSGEVAVLAAGAQWEVLAVNDLSEPIRATPIPADGRLYVRTASRVYAFESGDGPGGDQRRR